MSTLTEHREQAEWINYLRHELERWAKEPTEESGV